MSSSNMNAKYSSVEDTVVSKNHVLQLPNLSSKYQILSGTCRPTAITTSPTGNPVAVPPLNILDDNGKQLYIPTGAYIEKIIVSPKTQLESGALGTSTFDVQIAYRSTASTGHYVNTGTSLLSLINAAGATPALVTVDANGVTTGPQTGTIVNAGVVALPDVVLSSLINNYPVGVVGGQLFTGGEVRVTIFIVAP